MKANAIVCWILVITCALGGCVSPPGGAGGDRSADLEQDLLEKNRQFRAEVATLKQTVERLEVEKALAESGRANLQTRYDVLSREVIRLRFTNRQLAEQISRLGDLKDQRDTARRRVTLLEQLVASLRRRLAEAQHAPLTQPTQPDTP